MVAEAGLSDFRKMNATVMKIYYARQNPSVGHYYKFKNVCNNSFIKGIEILLSTLCNQQNVPLTSLLYVIHTSKTSIH